MKKLFLLAALAILPLCPPAQNLFAQDKSVPVPSAGSVTLPLDEYNRLMELASKPPRKPDIPPVPFIMKCAELNMHAADQLIQSYASTEDRTQFIDVATPMFGSNAKPPRDLYVFDGLHPSAKCYAIWTAAIKPVLLQRFGSDAAPAAAATH